MQGVEGQSQHQEGLMIKGLEEIDLHQDLSDLR